MSDHFVGRILRCDGCGGAKRDGSISCDLCREKAAKNLTEAFNTYKQGGPVTLDLTGLRKSQEWEKAVEAMNASRALRTSSAEQLDAALPHLLPLFVEYFAGELEKEGNWWRAHQSDFDRADHYREAADFLRRPGGEK